MTAETTFPERLGLPTPLGANVMPDGVHFTIFSRHATRVWLMLFDDPEGKDPVEEYELKPETHRAGDIWHLHVPDAKVGQCYVYRMEGRTTGRATNYFQSKQWILDPYARAVTGPSRWGDEPRQAKHRRHKQGPHFPKGVIVDSSFDWSGDRRLRYDLSETIIYETHLRGFTAHPSSGVQHPGTYAGFIEKIPYLQDLGITAVELLPIHHFNEMEYLLERSPRSRLRNYWGYSTMAFFAPMSRYAANHAGGQQVHEFKSLVKALHQAGIEVMLDVVYNHTCEGNEGGQTYSFRGIDNSIYYMMHGRHYGNYSGCGNTLNSNHPVVSDLIMHSLRYWVTDMHIDGFRFDLATALTRGLNGDILADPPLIQRISEDPILRDTKLIAEAWDAAGGYQVGSFPSKEWSEWNGKYRDHVRRFWKGDDGMLGRFAMRMTGSADLYHRDDQTPLKSINFVTCHDGFTMADLVSYSDKHNLANGEDNRDGESHNHSANNGIEGETHDPLIRRLRKRQQKNMLASILLSQGVPMLLAGDEFSRTQQGNNNAYCQDNEISWVDWSLLGQHADLHSFVKEMIALRKRHPCLRQDRFFHGGKGKHGKVFPDIHWSKPQGGDPDWDQAKTMGCLIDGHRKHIGTAKDDHSFFIMFNASKNPETFTLPPHPGEPWEIAITTEDKHTKWATGQSFYVIDGHAVAVMTSKPIPN